MRPDNRLKSLTAVGPLVAHLFEIIGNNTHRVKRLNSEGKVFSLELTTMT